ncbi:MAG: hypothetical protein C5B55_10130 [Blastocatellia bacterium]|nr:MAG: hypothetical protein C5B55_10130 [Blastocatellia bacterium]
MKVTVFKITLMLAVALSFTAISAHAQSVIKRQTFVVPFEFSVSNKVLPAGEYSVSDETTVIKIRSANGKQGVFTMPSATLLSTSKRGNSKLTFRREGDNYYLSQVWLPDGIGRQLRRPRTLGPEMAQNISIVEIPASSIQ